MVGGVYLASAYQLLMTEQLRQKKSLYFQEMCHTKSKKYRKMTTTCEHLQLSSSELSRSTEKTRKTKQNQNKS